MIEPTLLSSAPAAFWQNLFGIVFLKQLQDNQTSATGVLQVDISALTLRNDMTNAPAGFSSGVAGWEEDTLGMLGAPGPACF